MSVELISGPELKIKLKKKNIQQKDICEDLGYNQTTVSRYFTGTQQMPAKFIVEVAVYAGFEISDLVNIEIDPDAVDLDTSDSSKIEAADPEEVYEVKYKKKKNEIRNQIEHLVKEMQDLNKTSALRKNKRRQYLNIIEPKLRQKKVKSSDDDR
jgi:transcriptional regulator with XRE-family HTH domain